MQPDLAHDAPTVKLSRLGSYVLREQIGEGGMGIVHRATDPQGRVVAVKLLRPHVAGDAESRARFAREAQALARVRGEHVAQVLDADVAAATPYLVTDFVDGPSLHEIVTRDGPLEGADLADLAGDLADALCSIHGAGVVHRDLKPGNVLIQDGLAVVIDFGIAQIADDTRLTMPGTVYGTPGYVAPELLNGGDVTPAADIHAWAATVTYAATGRPPFGQGPLEAVAYRVLQDEPDLTGCPDWLVPVLRRCFAKDPATRPSARELLHWLETGEPPPEPTASLTPDDDPTVAIPGRPEATADAETAVYGTGTAVGATRPNDGVAYGDAGGNGHHAGVAAGHEAVGYGGTSYDGARTDGASYDAAGYGASGHDGTGYGTQGDGAGSYSAGGYSVGGDNAGGYGAEGYGAAGYQGYTDGYADYARGRIASSAESAAEATRLDTDPVDPGGVDARPLDATAVDHPTHAATRPEWGQAHRIVTLLTFATLAGLAAVMPTVAAIGLVGWLVLARTVDRSARLVQRRRSARGRRRTDSLAAVAALPWHVVRAVLVTVLTLPFALAGAGILLGLVILFFYAGALTPRLDIVLGATALVTAALAWWGIEGEGVQRGSRHILTWLLTPRWAPVAAGGVLVVLVLLTLTAASTEPVWWWPLEVTWSWFGWPG